MYTVVLMTALATTGSAPNWHQGCYGCGGYNYACYGCYGCYGGGCHGVGVWTFSGYGFAGGGAGYHGGCYGAYGAFYGDPYHGGCTGCYGCYGGYSCYGIPVPAIDTKVPASREPRPSVAPKKEVTGEPQPEEVAPPKEKKKNGVDDKKVPEPEKKKLPENLRLDSTTPIRAMVRIEVPTGGKLFVNGRFINVAAGTRVFQTPLLAAGERYYYDIRIEVDADGEIRSNQRRVIIEAGQDVAVSFPNLRGPETSTAQVNR